MRKLLISLSLILWLLCELAVAESLRISPEELVKLLDNPNYVILDARNKNDYDVTHVKNALSFPVELTYVNKKVNGQIQKPDKIQQYFRQRDIGIHSKVIIYDNGDLVDAARLFWTLEVYGIKHVKIVDHGFNYWLAKNLPVSQQQPEIKPGKYVATIDHSRLSSKFTTQLAIYNNRKLVIDARSEDAYKGKTSVAKRFGHIPTAINVPFNQNLIKDNKFAALKPIKELKKLYSNIPYGKKIIIYCKIGRVSSTNYFALRELGHDVSNYDASWREWGNDDSLPIEK